MGARIVWLGSGPVSVKPSQLTCVGHAGRLSVFWSSSSERVLDMAESRGKGWDMLQSCLFHLGTCLNDDTVKCARHHEEVWLGTTTVPIAYRKWDLLLSSIFVQWYRQSIEEGRLHRGTLPNIFTRTYATCKLGRYNDWESDRSQMAQFTSRGRVDYEGFSVRTAMI